MLHFMRKHAKFFYVFFFLIIISFIFFYVGPVDQNGSLHLAEIEEERISVEDFWRAYDNMRDYYRDIYKEKFDAEMEKELGLKERIVSELVGSKILYVAAKDMGLRVSDRELTEVIVNDPVFRREGKFRQDVYVRTLRLNRMTPSYYEKKKREDLLVKKLRHLIESSLVIPDDDIAQFKGMENIKEAIISSKKAQAVEAYVGGLKKKYHVVVRAELIS